MGSTVRTSVTDDGQQLYLGTEIGRSEAQIPQLSADGRWQLFTSESTDPDPDPNAPSDGSYLQRIYVRDVQNDHTIQISLGDSDLTAAGFTPDPAKPSRPDGTVPNGESYSPSISADGRYVSFLTEATNIVPVAGGGPATTIVVCDRDPTGAVDANGNLIFDKIVTVNGRSTRQYKCYNVRSEGQSDPFSIITQERPKLSGDGTHLVWTEVLGESPGVIKIARVSDSAGLVQPPTQPKDVPAVGFNPTPALFEPDINYSGNKVAMGATWFDGNSNHEAILETTLGTPSSTERLDVAPPGTSFTGYLGDPQNCGGDSCTYEVRNPLITDNGEKVLFTFTSFGLAGTPREVLATVGSSSVTSEIISLDNTGQEVMSDTGAISGDGRFVAFVTEENNTTDGADGAGEWEIVERDLVVDQQRAAQGLPRVPGAIVTVDANQSCDPQPPAVNCVSIDNGNFDISLDDHGTRVAFSAEAADLIPGDGSTTGDTNDYVDTFVRTWQPVLSSTSVDVGNVTIGQSVTRQVQVTVEGFGPVRLGATTVTGSGDVTPGATTCENALLFTGDTCTVAVRIAPQSAGSHTATVQLNSPQYDSPQDVATVSFSGAETGAAVAAADNVRTSVKDNGAQSPSGGSQGMISGNGRWQVFVSDSDLTGRTPIVPVSYGIRNVFVRDLADPQHTVQISLHTNVAASPDRASRPVQVKGHPTGASPNNDSFQPSISADGRFVSFVTTATDIVPNKWFTRVPPQGFSTLILVVCDRDPDGNGVLDEVTRGTQVPNYKCWPVESGNAETGERQFMDNYTPRLSGNGSRITYVEEDGNEDAQRAVTSDLSTPGSALHTPTAPALVPINLPEGSPFTGSAQVFDSADALVGNPRLNFDGSQVVFDATQPCCFDVTAVGVVRTTLATGHSVRFDTLDDGATYLGDAGGFMAAPAISDDGKRIAFAYEGYRNQFQMVYVATQVGGAISTVLESRNNNGKPSAGTAPALSGDGRYLAFETNDAQESNAIDPSGGNCEENGELPFYCQIVARDLVKDVAFFAGDQPWTPSEIVSSSAFLNCADPVPAGATCGAAGNSSNPSIDATGSEIGFDSQAQDIVKGDNDVGCGGECFGTDTFVHTWRPTLSATPSFNFGTVPVAGHRNRTYTVTESGFGPISVAGATVTGTNPSDFAAPADGCAGLTLNDGETCTFKLRFTPTAAGARTANLAYPVAKNGYPRVRPDGTATDPALLEGLTGLGVGGGGLTAQPSTLDFGPQLPLAPGSTSTVTLTNTSSGPLTITDVTVQDTTVPGASGDYTVNATDCLGVLQVGQSCVVQITFIGHKTGERGAQLVITDSESPTPSTVVLTAKVPKPKTLINPGVVEPGGVTMVFGTGFAPNRLVDVTLKGFSENASVRANAKGKFQVGLVIFNHTPEGGQIVIAQSHNADKSIGRANPLLIALGSIDDLQLVTRH